MAGFQPRYAALLELELRTRGRAAINMPLLTELSPPRAKVRVRCSLRALPKGADWYPCEYHKTSKNPMPARANPIPIPIPPVFWFLFWF
jgi:hypothetical protein